MALISFAVTAKLICVFVFAYADCWFFYGAAHLLFISLFQSRLSYILHEEESSKRSRRPRQTYEKIWASWVVTTRTRKRLCVGKTGFQGYAIKVPRWTQASKMVTTGKQYRNNYMYMSVQRKPTFCICENKGADELYSNCTADLRLCFRYSDSTIPLLLIAKISSL